MKTEKNSADANTAISQLFDGNSFADSQNAKSIFNRLTTTYPDQMKELLPWLIPALSVAADPDRSLVHFERLVDTFSGSFSLTCKKIRAWWKFW